MEAEGSSEILIPISQSTVHHVLLVVDPNIVTHCREALKFYIAMLTEHCGNLDIVGRKAVQLCR
jgi:hypothetical protein